MSSLSDRLRPEVLAFALEMERKLRLHDDRPGWKGDNVLCLFGRLQDEIGELKRAVGEGSPKDVILGEAADVANFAMFIADVCAALEAAK